MPRQFRDPGPCRRFRVMPDLVVMGEGGEGGEGGLPGWPFTPRWESPHHSGTGLRYNNTLQYMKINVKQH